MTNLLQITEFYTLQAIKTVEIVSRLIKGDEKCTFATPTRKRGTARFCGFNFILGIFFCFKLTKENEI